MTNGGSTYGGTAVGSTGTATTFESAALSAGAEAASAETASAAEAGTGASLSFAIGAERKVLRDNGALVATTAPTATEGTAGTERGGGTGVASPAVTGTARVDLTGTASALATPAITATGRKGEAGTVSALATSTVIERFRIPENGSVSSAANANALERRVGKESGLAQLGATLAAQETILVTESGAATTTALPFVDEDPGFLLAASVSVTATPGATEAVTEAQVSVADVENYAALGWQQLEPEVKNTMLQTAQALIENQFTDRTSTLPTLVGDKDDATELLAAHLFDLAEGGEAQSEGGEAGNVTYNTTAGETLNSLTETRFGRLFADVYLRDRMGIGVVRSR